MDTPPPATAPAQSPAEDKTVAIVSYLTLIGFVAAIIIHNSKKTQLGSFHLRQMLGVIVASFVGVFANFVLLMIPILGWLAMIVGWALLLVVWVMGFIAAVNGEMKPAPILGPYFQKWFGNAFA